MLVDFKEMELNSYDKSRDKSGHTKLNLNVYGFR
jgi:hypothetical protein